MEAPVRRLFRSLWSETCWHVLCAPLLVNRRLQCQMLIIISIPDPLVMRHDGNPAAYTAPNRGRRLPSTYFALFAPLHEVSSQETVTFKHFAWGIMASIIADSDVRTRSASYNTAPGEMFSAEKCTHRITSILKT